MRPRSFRLFLVAALLGVVVAGTDAILVARNWAPNVLVHDDARRDSHLGYDLTEAFLPNVALGDEAAMQACIARYGGVVWTLARRLSSSKAEAEDAVQEIFLDLWRSAHRFDASRGTELAFVAVIARRRLVDRRRAEKRRPQVEPFGGGEEERQTGATEPSAEIAAEVALASRALDDLSPPQRDVLLLSAVDGMSHEEIARSRGMALGTVKSHARRALLRMRALLALGRSQEGNS